VSATYRPGPATAGDTDVPGYAVTYFPGTVNAAQAQRVAIGVGRSLDDVDIALVPVKTAQITGTVVNREGKPMAGGFVNVLEADGAFGGIGALPGPTARSPSGTCRQRHSLQAQSQFRQGERQETATTAVTVMGRTPTVFSLSSSRLYGLASSRVDPAAAAAIRASSISTVVAVSRKWAASWSPDHAHHAEATQSLRRINIVG
jgi:hypothetical protein